MNRSVIIGLAAGLAILAGLAAWILSRTVETAPPTAAHVSAAPSGAATAMSAVPPVSSVTNAPWMAASNPAGGVAIPTAGKAGAPAIDVIQKRLQALSAGGKTPSPKELDAVLADLQRNQGKDVVAGVNIAALRENLTRIDRIQQVAREIQAIAANNPKKEDLPRLQGLIAEMQGLQSGIQAQVMVAPTPAVGK